MLPPPPMTKRERRRRRSGGAWRYPSDFPISSGERSHSSMVDPRGAHITNTPVPQGEKETRHTNLSLGHIEPGGIREHRIEVH